MFKKLSVGALAALGVAIIAASPVKAQSVEDFYKGRTITLVYGFGAGGTYGRYSLTLADFLSRYIPGHPKIVAQSMPGAGGLKAANFAYNVMAKDGSGLYMPVDSMIISQLLRPKKVKFQADKFTWLGTVVQSNAVIVVRSDAGINTLSDLKNKQVVMASSGKGSQTFLMPQLLNALYGAKFKIVAGYRGSRKMQLSMEQGESQGVSLTWLAWSSAKPQWFKPGGFAKPLVQIGVTKDPALPNVPMFSDVVKSADDKAIVNFMASMSPIGRGLAVPPGVPADRTKALQAAFAKVIADPAFAVAAKKRRLEVNGLSAAQIQKIVNDALKISPAIVKRAQKLIMGAK
jgi:tripartite-type tricarboxylate transporter receptor subunit TctC